MSNFLLVFVIDLVIGLAIGWFLMWLYWRRRFDGLRREMRELSAENSAITVKYNALQADIKQSTDQIDTLNGKNQELSAALALAEVKMQERSPQPLRPIDELAWETKLETANREIQRLREQVDALQADVAKHSPDQLQSISGIGKVFAQRLNAAGVLSYAQLAALSAQRVRDIVKAEEWQAIDPQSWIDQAAKMSRR